MKLSSPVRVWGAALAIAALIASLTLKAEARQGSGQNAADGKEVRNFVLTSDGLDKYQAAVNALAKLVQSDPELRKKLNTDNDSDDKNQSIDADVRKVEAEPGVVASLKSSGLTPRQWIVMTGTMLSCVTAVAMKKAGQISAYPAIISPQNAAFTEKNYDRMRAVLEQLGDATNSDQ